jgi:hypothetical protein
MAEIHPATKAILQYFEFDHLREGPLRDTSKKCHDLAYEMALSDELGGAELTAGLRKLLEAKDCFVRAALANPLES